MNTILLVEDNPADMRLVREALAESGLPIALLWASNGTEALAMLRRTGDHAEAAPPDLVLLDLNLPGLGGKEVLGEIKRDPALAGTPVIVLSSSAAPRDVQDCHALHVNSYIVKPTDFEATLALLGMIGAYWFGAVVLPTRARS